MVATSSFLTALECTKSFSAGAPTGGAYSAPPDLLASLRGTNSKGEGEGGKDKGEEKGRRKKGETLPPLSQIPRSAPVSYNRQN